MTRFWQHPDTSCPVLVEPVRELVRRQVQRTALALCVHDWCVLPLAHTHKTDCWRRTHVRTQGYDLLSALLVCVVTGQPFGVMELQLQTRHGFIGTRPNLPRGRRSHLDQLLPVMQNSRTWRLSPRLIHVIDREADSVDHYRQWAQHGHYFLVRADDRRVRWHRTSCLLSEIVPQLRRSRQFLLQPHWSETHPGEQLWLASTEVVLYRAAKKNVRGKRWYRSGVPLPLRLIVSQIRQRGHLLAEWWLLSNVPESWADAVRLTQWYYWRWQIESYHKLLKSAGFNVRDWLQQKGERVAKRLLIANMACALVWRLQRDPSAEAQQLRAVLVELSGRQMKGKGTATVPALLGGLEKLLAVLKLTERISVVDLKQLLEKQMPELFPKPPE